MLDGADELLPGAGEASLITLLMREPGESFFGVGNDSRRSHRTRHQQLNVEARVDYRRRIGQFLAVDAEVGYRLADIGDARIGDDPNTRDSYGRELPGLGPRTQLARAAMAVKTTLVDIPGSPTRGNKTMARLGYSQSLNGAALSHVSLTAVTEQFHELFYRRTLSVRLGTDWRFAPGSNAVPFYDLASVGGELFVRGFQRGRFRDRGSAFTTVTYRFPVARFLDASLLYETGRTFHRLDDISLRDWHPAFGGGFRTWVPRGIVFELNVIRSSEEARVHFSFDTVF